MPLHALLSKQPRSCQLESPWWGCLFPWVHRQCQVHQRSLNHASSPCEAVLALQCPHASWFLLAAFFRGCMGIVGCTGWKWEMGVKKNHNQNNMKTTKTGRSKQIWLSGVLELPLFWSNGLHVGMVSSLLPSCSVLDIHCLRSCHCPASSLTTCFVHTWSWHQWK